MDFPKFPFRAKKQPKEFLLIEIGLEVVNMATLVLSSEPKIKEVGSKKFKNLEEMFDASLEAIDELAGKVDDIPKTAILGVSGGPVKTETTVAQYTRPTPKDPISEEEIAKALEEVSSREEPGDLKLFFSTIASAVVDDTKVSNPIGIKGEKTSLSCFIAYKHPEELAVFDKLVDEIDMKLEKIIPTSFAVAKDQLKSGNEDALLIRLSSIRAEATLLTGGHIDRIVQFDLGASNPELFSEGLEAILKSVPNNAKPDILWLYQDNLDVEMLEVSEKLESFSWEEFGFKNKPTIRMAGKGSEEAESQVGLSALVTEATE